MALMLLLPYAPRLLNDTCSKRTQSHRRMKADTEWEALTNKVAGKDVAYKDVRVECWIAAILDDAEHPVAQQV